MGKRLFITEKPSVARDFAKALHVNGGGKDGYIEDNDTIITWCVGHLVTMSYPEKYDPDLKSWKLDTLPFLPKTFKYEVIESVAKQFGIVKTQIERKDVDHIYYSGDAAREGEYIQRLVRQFCNIGSNVEERRVWIDSQTEEEIQRGIREAKLLSEYDLISDAGYMRAIEDYLFGINLSRAYTLKFGRLYNNIVGNTNNEVIAVGRVMTCVLGMIVNRERLIKGSKEILFYGLRGFVGDSSADWKTTETSAYFESPMLYKPGAFSDKKNAEELKAKCEAKGQLLFKNKEKNREKKSAPMLYNLAELQGECSSALKITPDQTLQIVQTLYEKKMVTYPRTDARVLSSAVAKEIANNINGLKSHPVVGKCASMIDAGYINNIGNTKYTNDALISDHYAIIPTGKEVSSYNSLGDDEKTVYTMICRRFLAIFYPEAVYEKIAYFFDCDGESFQAATKTLVTPGYLSVYDKTVEETEEMFSGLKEGESYNAKFEIVEGKTQPPKRYTSGSIILAMENAGQLIEDADLRAQIKSSGIGTSATRAEILKKLIANNYVTLNKKTQALSPSERGEVIFDIVNTITPSLLRPEMTANWEKGLDMVASGDVTKEGYLEKLYAYVNREVNAVKDANVEEIKKNLPEEKIKTSSSGGYTKMEVKPKFKKTAPAKMPEVCPHCGGKIREFEKGYGCNKCNAVVWKKIGQTMLPEEQLTKLFCSGETDFIEFKKKDGSGTFTAKLKAASDWSTKFVFQEKK